MIKLQIIRFRQRAAGPESVIHRTQDSNYQYASNHIFQNLRARENYLVPGSARRTIPSNRVAFSTPDHINLPPHIKRGMFVHLKKLNTEHWVNELLNGTQECAQLPAIKPRPNHSVTINLEPARNTK